MMETLENTNIDQFKLFPGTRYMGSKRKIIPQMWKILKNYHFNSFYDAFAGSNIVSYFMKCQGKRVVTNDIMALSHSMSKAVIENSLVKLTEEELNSLICTPHRNNFIQRTYNGIFFNELENSFLDRVRGNIENIESSYKKHIALTSLARACMKKQSRGIFTFVGERYNDGREDMQKSIEDHFIESVKSYNKAIFDNGEKNIAYNRSAEKSRINVDLVYLDPPYFTPNSDNDYTRRYHFVEGLVKNWEGLEIQNHTLTKKFMSYKTPFSKKGSAYAAFNELFEKYRNSIIAISYSSNSLPTKHELLEMLSKHKTQVEVHEIDHTYSFGNQGDKIGNSANRVKEYLFIGS